MKQFNLEDFKKNSNRKVVTRDGRPVRIICLDRQCELEYNYPIIALVSVENTEVPVISNKEGKTWNNNEINDLFFADEEDGLTEFEKEIAEAYEWAKTTEREDFVNEFAPKLFDLARKELQPEIDKELDKAYKNQDDVVYRKGKEDALKDLPKWKKATKGKEFDRHVLLFENEKRVVLTTELYKGDYYIELDSLKTLPKEE